MQKRPWLFLAIALSAMIAVGAYGWYSGERPQFGLEILGQVLATSSTETEPPPEQTVAAEEMRTAATSTVETNASVEKVTDGDTFEAKLDGEDKIHKIRLLGINTPETVDPRRPVECFGKQASDKMKELVQAKRIRLEADPQADERDKYGRLLRNAYLEDGTDINAFMVREGYAYAYISYPQDAKRKKELKKLEEDAKMAQRGLWDPTACNGQK